MLRSLNSTQWGFDTFVQYQIKILGVYDVSFILRLVERLRKKRELSNSTIEERTPYDLQSTRFRFPSGAGYFYAYEVSIGDLVAR